MQAHIVLAHPEAQSFNGHINVARDRFEASGWVVTVSELHKVGFDPLERHSHYNDSALLGPRRDNRTTSCHRKGLRSAAS